MRTGRSLTVCCSLFPGGGGVLPARGGWWFSLLGGFPLGGSAWSLGGGFSLRVGGSAWSGGGSPCQGGLPGPGGVPDPCQGGVVLPAGGGSPCRGGSAWSWGVCLPGPGGGVSLSEGSAQRPPPVNRITHTCKNIDLATTSLRPVKIAGQWHKGGYCFWWDGHHSSSNSNLPWTTPFLNYAASGRFFRRKKLFGCNWWYFELNPPMDGTTALVEECLKSANFETQSSDEISFRNIVLGLGFAFWKSPHFWLSWLQNSTIQHDPLKMVLLMLSECERKPHLLVYDKKDLLEGKHVDAFLQGVETLVSNFDIFIGGGWGVKCIIQHFWRLWGCGLGWGRV